MYWSIFNQLRWVRIALLTGGTLITLCNIAFIVGVTTLLTPAHGQTWLEHAQSGRLSEAVRWAVPVGVVGFLGDVFILVIPIPALWNLQMRKRRKFAMMFIFLWGAS